MGIVDTGPEPRPIPARFNIGTGGAPGSPEITFTGEQLDTLRALLDRHGANAIRVNVRKGERFKATDLFLQTYDHAGGWSPLVVVRPSGAWVYEDGGEQWR